MRLNRILVTKVSSTNCDFVNNPFEAKSCPGTMVIIQFFHKYNISDRDILARVSSLANRHAKQ